MNDIFVFIMVLMGALAILDLIVGVSNDAVNFIGAAVGSKAASFKTIMIIASIGVMMGAIFSNGMMEVARRGVFHPDMFLFDEVMMIFLAVMITDVILLDVFNTLGLPTSTTVSLVFELLGASVAVSMFKIMGSDASGMSFMAFVNDMSALEDYINYDKAVRMITGIFAVVIIAFAVGAVVQWLVRLLLTFDYHRRLKYFGGVIGGVAITAIVFYMLLKGSKGTTIISDEGKIWINEHIGMLGGLCFAVFTVVSQVLVSFFRVNILKIIVFTGTFALAMAFAGNDLVNFIGVPLAALGSFDAYVEAGGANIYMTSLMEDVKTPIAFLLGAGIIMVITLWVSKKAHNVLKTSIDLSRYEGGEEKFRPNTISKLMVRGSVYAGKALSCILPRRISEHIELRFDRPAEKETRLRDAPAFDMVRASVNVVVPAVIISIGTNSTLPLSTTYITFMVAMGSSLADRAWGLESAVYRVSGVVRVILGWFATALIAFFAAASLALLLKMVGTTAIIPIIAVAGLTIATIKFFKKLARRTMPEKEDDMRLEYTDAASAARAFDMKVSDVMIDAMRLCGQAIKGVNMHSRSVLVNALRSNDINGPQAAYYVRSLSYLVALEKSVGVIVKSSFEHIDNNHKTLIQYRRETLISIGKRLDMLFGELSDSIRENDYSSVHSIRDMVAAFSADIDRVMAREADRIGENKEFSRRNTNLYFGILFEVKSILWALSGFSTLFDRNIAADSNARR